MTRANPSEPAARWKARPAISSLIETPQPVTTSMHAHTSSTRLSSSPPCPISIPSNIESPSSQTYLLPRSSQSSSAMHPARHAPHPRLPPLICLPIVLLPALTSALVHEQCNIYLRHQYKWESCSPRPTPLLSCSPLPFCDELAEATPPSLS